MLGYHSFMATYRQDGWIYLVLCFVFHFEISSNKIEKKLIFQKYNEETILVLSQSNKETILALSQSVLYLRSRVYGVYNYMKLSQLQQQN
jgi:hypothetical protein